MTVRVLFDAIESHEFAAKVGIASSRSLFLGIVEADISYRELYDLVRRDNYAAEAVLARIKRLSELRYDRKFQHPHDVALAVYCWIVFRGVPVYSSVAVDFINSTNDTWWATKIAELISLRISSASDSWSMIKLSDANIFGTRNAFEFFVETSALTKEIDFLVASALDRFQVISPEQMRNFNFASQITLGSHSRLVDTRSANSISSSVIDSGQ
jgi:hypothetical protein